ncbi:hypothetical protein SAMN02787118_12126 [Streptomyces mirabilis]|jgi:hypothetical protein|uniref:Transposase DDE domain-containing protein n=2 Tax=Streptomyces TaxID=1883 RepID=A0A1I2RYR6_9ACTN|nr:hypothetical protein SAMN02787118_12126 [Streptomyces mirabilis]
MAVRASDTAAAIAAAACPACSGVWDGMTCRRSLAEPLGATGYSTTMAATPRGLRLRVRACGLRRTRYRGLPKTHIGHVLTALACSVTRIADWIAEPTRPRRAPSHFRALCTAPS